MEYEKSITTTVAIANPMGICKDKEKNVLKLLKEKYEGRCFSGAYIREVTGIERISDCRITNMDDTAGGIIEVIFKAATLITCPWDYIIGIKINQTSPYVTGESSFVPPSSTDAKTAPAKSTEVDAKTKVKKPYLVSFLNTPEVRTLQVGQLVCARVVPGGVLHDVGKAHSTLVAVPATCEQAFPVYKINNKLKKEAAQQLAPLVAAIKRELQLRATLEPAGMLFFENLLYRPARANPKATQETAVGVAAPTAVVAAAGTAGAAVGAAGAAVGAPGGASLKYVGIPVPESKGRRDLIAIVEKALAGETQSMEGVWGRPLDIPASSPFVVTDDALLEAPLATVQELEMKAADAVAMLLSHMLNALYLVRGMVQTYNTLELVKSHNSVWLFMEKKKGATSSS